MNGEDACGTTVDVSLKDCTVDQQSQVFSVSPRDSDVALGMYRWKNKHRKPVSGLLDREPCTHVINFSVINDMAN